MPLIRVVSRMGKPPAAPMQASLGPGICTLGRSPDCTLPLPDESRHISRQQARVELAGGKASITCLSAASPLIINGQELHQGQSHQLAHGDRIHVAEYELRFEEVDGSQALPGAGAGIPNDPFSVDPFAVDPFADIASGAASRKSSDVPSRAPSYPQPREPSGAWFDGPGDAAPIPEEFDPFGDAPPANRHRGGPASTEPGADPGADPLGMGLRKDPLAEVAAGRADSIDALFNLGPGLDPLAPDSPLGRPPGDKARTQKQIAADRAGDPVADDAPELSGSFRLPQAIPPTGFGLTQDPVLSWKKTDAAREAAMPSPASDAARIAAPAEPAFDVSRSDPKRPYPPYRPHDVSPPLSAGSGLAGLPDGSGDASPSCGSGEAPSAHGVGVGDAAGLLHALLQGLGMAELPRIAGPGGPAPQPLTPELMQRLGELLATACEGTVELLQARATLKQGLRADVTMIQASDNNPLKFAPDGHSALAQLLAPHTARGFMAPRRAMRDAYDDLLAHQIGFVAGMRAAMQGMIGRFDPEALETRLAGRAVLDAMVPAARKARLWELFTTLHAQVCREAEDDFDRLFGRAFVAAYEEQIARLQTSPRRPDVGAADPRG